jgi:hypothetical protein
MQDVTVRLLKDNIVIGTQVHVKGDVVSVPARRAEGMLRYQEAVLHAPVIESATAGQNRAERATSPRQR